MDSLKWALRFPQILRFFQNLSSHAPEEEKNPKERGSSQLLLPALPPEIWYDIFELVVRPSFVVDLIFDPSEIDRAYRCLMNPFLPTHKVAKHASLKNWKNLRLVCRTWKDLAGQLQERRWALHLYDWNKDKPDIDPHWFNLERTNIGLNSPLINTHQCARLDLTYFDNADPQISIRYSHPVSTLSISISPTEWGTRNSGYIKSLKDLSSFPSHVNVLCLRVRDLDTSGDLVHDLQHTMTSLTTLSLCFNNTSILQTPLEIPNLATLFLSIPQFTSKTYSSWKLPCLRHLSLSTILENPWNADQGDNLFFLGLIEEHFDQIHSLRMLPTIHQVMNRASPLCWVYMPNLQALAADFSTPMDPSQDPDHLEDSNPLSPTTLTGSTRSPSVRHLVQVARTSRPWVDNIQSYIHACQWPETVSLVTNYVDCKNLLYGPPPSGCIAGTLRILAEQLKRLKCLCDTYHIQLMDSNGNLICEDNNRRRLFGFLNL